MPKATIHKTFRILLFMVDEAKYRPIREISNELSIPRSTLHRILQALVDEEILEFDKNVRQYSWGNKLIYIARSVYQSVEIRRMAMPLLREIVDKTNETAQLILYESKKRKIIFTDEMPCQQPIRYHAPVGVFLPCHAGASGKVIMAFLPDEEVENIISSGLQRITPQTITSPKELRKNLNEIRSIGYAITHGERSAEIIGIACPVFNADFAIIGGLMVTIPAYRFRSELKDSIVKMLLEKSELLSRLIGLPSGSPYPP
jgi:DNA-binding IclR family transcriptional regulator